MMQYEWLNGATNLRARLCVSCMNVETRYDRGCNQQWVVVVDKVEILRKRKMGKRERVEEDLLAQKKMLVGLSLHWAGRSKLHISERGNKEPSQVFAKINIPKTPDKLPFGNTPSPLSIGSHTPKTPTYNKNQPSRMIPDDSDGPFFPQCHDFSPFPLPPESGSSLLPYSSLGDVSSVSSIPDSQPDEQVSTQDLIDWEQASRQPSHGDYVEQFPAPTPSALFHNTTMESAEFQDDQADQHTILEDARSRPEPMGNDSGAFAIGKSECICESPLVFFGF